MSEKEVNIGKKLSDTIPKLDKEKQNYVLGIVEGMAFVRDSQRDKQLQKT